MLKLQNIILQNVKFYIVELLLLLIPWMFIWYSFCFLYWSQ